VDLVSKQWQLGKILEQRTIFHAIEIRIIPLHIFTDKQRIQAHCLMYRYAPTLGPSSLYITTATTTRSMEKEENQTTN
jgi:hypothetical protein